MSRLNLDASLGWMLRESVMPAPGLLNVVPPRLASFDQLLQQAQSTPDSIRDPFVEQPPPACAPDGPAAPAVLSSPESGDPESTGAPPERCETAAGEEDLAFPQTAASPPSESAAGENTPPQPPGPDPKTTAHKDDPKRLADAPARPAADAADKPRPRAAKNCPKHADAAKPTRPSAPSEANGGPTANHGETEKTRASPGSPAAGQVLQGVEPTGPSESDSLLVAPVAEQAGTPGSLQQAQPARAAKGVELPKPDPSGDGVAGAAFPAETPDDTSDAPGSCSGPSSEAAVAAQGQAGSDSVVLQGELPDSQGAIGAARRAGPRQIARGGSEPRPVPDAFESTLPQDGPALSAEMRTEIPSPPDAELPATRVDQPAKAVPGSPGEQSGTTGTVGRIVGGSEPTARSEPSPQPAAKDPQSDTADRVRFVQRVSRAFEAAADRGGHIRMRLYPPELGSLRLDLTVRNGAMIARMETETETARNMLLDNLPALKQRLAEHQIRVERFDVDWQGPSQGGLSQGPGDGSRWQAPAAVTFPGTVASSRREAAAETPGQARVRPDTEASFDVVI